MYNIYELNFSPFIPQGQIRARLDQANSTTPTLETAVNTSSVHNGVSPMSATVDLEKFGTLDSKHAFVELLSHQITRALHTAFQEEIGIQTMEGITDLTIQARLLPGLLADKQEVLRRNINMNITMISMTNLPRIAIHLNITLGVMPAIRMDI